MSGDRRGPAGRLLRRPTPAARLERSDTSRETSQLKYWLRPSGCWIGWWSSGHPELARPTLAAQRPDNSREARAADGPERSRGRGIRDPRVIAAMGEVPRHLFLPPEERKSAYQDAALPIGNGQTITSPYVVAFMTEQLEPQASDKVLEIGTGSGYQASILSRLVAEVYTIEIVEPLGRRATKTIQQLGYDNVHVRIGDGFLGWPEHAPFDKIIVTCSPEKVPQPLVDQLKEGGRLVVPLGERFQQMLYLFRKTDGQLQQEKLESTFFVPMTGEAEAQREHKDDSGTPQVVNGTFEEVGRHERDARLVLRSPGSHRGRRHRTRGTTAHGAHEWHSRPVRPCAAGHRRGRPHNQRAHPDRAAADARCGGTGRQVSLATSGTGLLRRNARSDSYRDVGPWDGDHPWGEERLVAPVPGRARFAMLAVAMFGGTGELAVDDLQVTASKPGK